MKSYQKLTRVKLNRNSKAWRDLVHDVYVRESGICQGCGKWLPENEAAAHHIKTYGSGGSDVIENLELVDKFCHVKIDSGELIKCIQCGGYVLRCGKCRNCGYQY